MRRPAVVVGPALATIAFVQPVTQRPGDVNRTAGQLPGGWNFPRPAAEQERQERPPPPAAGPAVAPAAALAFLPAGAKDPLPGSTAAPALIRASGPGHVVSEEIQVSKGRPRRCLTAVRSGLEHPLQPPAPRLHHPLAGR